MSSSDFIIIHNSVFVTTVFILAVYSYLQCALFLSVILCRAELKRDFTSSFVFFFSFPRISNPAATTGRKFSPRNQNPKRHSPPNLLVFTKNLSVFRLRHCPVCRRHCVRPCRRSASGEEPPQLHQGGRGLRVARERFSLPPPDPGVPPPDRVSHQPRRQAANKEYHLPRH